MSIVITKPSQLGKFVIVGTDGATTVFPILSANARREVYAVRRR